MRACVRARWASRRDLGTPGRPTRRRLSADQGWTLRPDVTLVGAQRCPGVECLSLRGRRGRWPWTLQARSRSPRVAADASGTGRPRNGVGALGGGQEGPNSCVAFPGPGAAEESASPRLRPGRGRPQRAGAPSGASRTAEPAARRQPGPSICAARQARVLRLPPRRQPPCIRGRVYLAFRKEGRVNKGGKRGAQGWERGQKRIKEGETQFGQQS